MGQEQTAAFYDGRLERVGLPLEASPWLSVYATVADLLPPARKDKRIADIGCGTGRLARLLQIRGHTRYWGVDFSPARIAEARSYVPELSFDVGDVFDAAVQARFAAFDAFACLEILEHVHGDLDLLAALPSGAEVVFSVPNYPSEGHVRTFASIDDAIGRYAGLLEFDGESHAVLPRPKASKKIFVLRAVRR